MMPTNTIPTTNNDVAIGKRTNGSEMLIAISLTARGHFGCVDFRACNQAVLTVDDDFLPSGHPVRYDSFADARLTDLNGLHGDTVVRGDGESEQAVGTVLYNTVGH